MAENKCEPPDKRFFFRVNFTGFPAELIRNKQKSSMCFGLVEPSVQRIVNINLINEVVELKQQHDKLLAQADKKLKDIEFNILVGEIFKSYLERIKIRLHGDNQVYSQVSFSSDEVSRYKSLKEKLRDYYEHGLSRNDVISELLQQVEFLHISIYHLKNFLKK